MYCNEKCITRREGDERIAVTLRCRAWTCEECAPIRRRRLMAEAMGGSPTTFLTLTIRRTADRSPEDAARELSRAWRCARLRLMRHYGWRKLPFLAVFEGHLSGYPHLHILARCGWIDQKLLSSMMGDLIGSPYVHISHCRDKGRTAGYVAKYITKQNAKFGNCKRYWQSPDFDLRPEPEKKLPFPPGEGWEIQDLNLNAWCAAWASIGWTIERESQCKARARPPP